MTAKRVKTVCNDGYEVSGSDDFSETTGFFTSEQNHSCLPCVVSGVQNCSNDKDKEAPRGQKRILAQDQSSDTKDYISPQR